MTFADFIEEKGENTISCALGVDQGLVKVWKCRNSIPRRRWAEVLVAFPTVKVDDLFVMSLQSERAA
jgi:hypothetical protein